MSINRSGAFVSSLFLLLVTACSSGAGGTGGVSGCQTDNDCSSPRVCSASQCVDPAAAPATTGKGGSGNNNPAQGAGGSGTGTGGMGTGPGGMGTGTGGNPFGGSAGTAGGGSAGSPPAATCDLSFNDSGCDSCYQSKCKASCAACSGNVDCVNLVNCIAKCTTSSCVDSCGTAFSKGVADYNAQASCAFGSTSCGPLCDTGRDLATSCSHDYQCSSGSCAGTDGSNGWCTESCSNSDQCGAYAYCSKNSAGSYSCFPACTTNAGCSYIGPGATCGTGVTAEGYNHTMCAYWN